MTRPKFYYLLITETKGLIMEIDTNNPVDDDEVTALAFVAPERVCGPYLSKEDALAVSSVFNCTVDTVQKINPDKSRPLGLDI